MAFQWRTLLSVDDVIGSVLDLVEELGQMNATYFLYTSDHGYSLVRRARVVLYTATAW